LVQLDLGYRWRCLIGEIEMKKRDKWILILSIVVCSGSGLGVLMYLGYFAVSAMRDLDRMEARRPTLLYETDHRALLKACKEISKLVAAGRLEPGEYQIQGNPDPESKQFAQVILDLDPLRVDVEPDGQVDIIMSPVVMYGVSAFPEDYERSRSGEGGIELIDGLWYYDEDFLRHPEHKKEVEELLKKRKRPHSPGVP